MGDESIRCRHVQLNSALFLVYHMLHTAASNAPVPANADEAKVKTDRANKLFHLKTRQIACLEESQLVGLAYTLSKHLLNTFSSSGATVDPEETKLKHSRILERFLRHSFSVHTSNDAQSVLAAVQAAKATASKGKEKAQTQQTLSTPHLALLTCEAFEPMLEGLLNCLMNPFVDLPAPAPAPAAKATASSSSSSTASTQAKTTTTAKASSSSSKQTASVKASSSAAKPAASTSNAKTSSAAAAAPATAESYPYLSIKDKDRQAIAKIISAPAVDAPKTCSSLENILAELVSNVAPAAHLDTPQTRLFLQSLLWSSHASANSSPRDHATILNLCLHLTGVWGGSLQNPDLCKKSAPTIDALKELTGAAPAEGSRDLRKLFPFGAARAAPWANNTSASLYPVISGFHLRPSVPTTLTQVPLSPVLVLSDSDARFALQSSHPTEFASRLPLSTLLRYHVRGFGYDGLSMFEQNAADCEKVKHSVPLPKLSADRAANLLHPLVLLSRASSADIKAFEIRSAECQGKAFFQSSVPIGSTLHRILLSTFQRFPNDSLSYLLFLESRFDSWMTSTDDENSLTERAVLLQKLSSLFTQSSAQLSHLVAKLASLAKSASSQASAFLKSMIYDSLDTFVPAAYLRAASLLHQGEYRSAITACTEAHKRISSALEAVFKTQNNVSETEISSKLACSYPFYTLQFHLITARSYARLRHLDQAKEFYMKTLALESWNLTALLGISSVLSSDTTYGIISDTSDPSNASSTSPEYYDLVAAIGHLEKALSFYPNHVWTFARLSYLKALPYIYLSETKQRNNILSILSKPRETPAAKRQHIWLGTLIQGIGEGIISSSNSDTSASEASLNENVVRFESDGPIIKGTKASDKIAAMRARGQRMLLEDDLLFETSLRLLASSLLSKTIKKNIKASEASDSYGSSSTFSVSSEEELELMRIAIKSRDALKAIDADHHDWHWIQHYLGAVELSLGNDVDAKEAFRGSKDENPFSSAAFAHLLVKAYIQHGTELDLEAATNHFSRAMETYGSFKRSEKFLPGTGRGDGALLLEAAIPLSHIWLEQCAQEEQQITSETEDVEGALETENYQRAMALLRTISDAGHKWASFKAATYQLRRGALDHALASVLAFLRFFPRHADASVLLIEIYCRQGKMAAALKACQKLLVVANVDDFSHSATLFFVSALLHFKVNLVSTSIDHIKRCLLLLEKESQAPTTKTAKSEKLKSFPHMKTWATYLLVRMLLSESIRMSKEGRSHDASVALESANVIFQKASLLPASGDPKSTPLSLFSIHKLHADIHSTKFILFDLSEVRSSPISEKLSRIESMALSALKSYNYALQHTNDEVVSALVHKDLATIYVTKSQLVQHALEVSESSAEEKSKALTSVLQSLDSAVDEAKKCVLLLSPASSLDAPVAALQALSSYARALLLGSWRTLASLAASYLRTLVSIKNLKISDLKLNVADLHLKHIPSAQTVSYYYTYALSAFQNSRGISKPDEQNSNPENASVSQAILMTAAESKEFAHTWADAGLFWMWTQAPAEVVQEALSKAKKFDPSVLASWTLHALILLKDANSLSRESTSTNIGEVFGYQTQKIDTVMAGLLLALEEDETASASVNPTHLDLYSPDLDVSSHDDAEALGAEMQNSSGSSGGREWTAKALPLSILLTFALREMNTVPFSENDDLKTIAAKTSVSQLEPRVLARRVYALSSRYIALHSYDQELVTLHNNVARAIGLEKANITDSDQSRGLTLPNPFKVESTPSSVSESWLVAPRGEHTEAEKGGKDISKIVSALPVVPSGSSKESWSSMLLQAAKCAKSPATSLAADLASVSSSIASIGANASKAIPGSDYVTLMTHCRTLLNVVISIFTNSLKTASSATVPSVRVAIKQALHNLLDSVSSGIFALQEVVSAAAKAAEEKVDAETGANDDSTTLLTQMQLLFTYCHWIGTFLRARSAWALEERASKSKTSSSISALTQLLSDMAQEPSTSEPTTRWNFMQKTPPTVPARRVIAKPILHGPAHVLVAPGAPALPSFTSFVTDVSSDLLRMLLIAGEGVAAATLWKGVLPFNVLSTNPVLVEMLDTTPRDLLYANRPVEASTIEAALWTQFGQEMSSVETSLANAEIRAISNAQAKWLQQNISKETAEETPAAAISAATSTPSSSTPSTVTSSDSIPAPSQAESQTTSAAKRAKCAAQRAVLLRPWDDSKWRALAAVDGL